MPRISWGWGGVEGAWEWGLALTGLGEREVLLIGIRAVKVPSGFMLRKGRRASAALTLIQQVGQEEAIGTPLFRNCRVPLGLQTRLLLSGLSLLRFSGFSLRVRCEQNESLGFSRLQNGFCKILSKCSWHCEAGQTWVSPYGPFGTARSLVIYLGSVFSVISCIP